MTTLPNARHDRLPHLAGSKVSWSAWWGPDQDARRPVTGVAAATAIAGAIHLGVGLGHGPAGHGLLMLAVGATQTALAPLVHRRPSRMRLTAVVAINATVALAWLLTYTPTDGRGAEITSAGLAATALEVTAALIAVTIRGRHTPGPPRRTSIRAVALVGPTAVAAGIFGWAGHGQHHHDQPPPTTASAEAEPISATSSPTTTTRRPATPTTTPTRATIPSRTATDRQRNNPTPPPDVTSPPRSGSSTARAARRTSRPAP